MEAGHEELPTTFDVVIVGSGLPESILAAAFARAGISVLHLDRNDYYGSDWASFSMDGFEDWLLNQQVFGKAHEKVTETPAPGLVTEDETFIPFDDMRPAAVNVKFSWNLSEDDTMADVTDLPIESPLSSRFSAVSSNSGANSPYRSADSTTTEDTTQGSGDRSAGDGTLSTEHESGVSEGSSFEPCAESTPSRISDGLDEVEDSEKQASSEVSGSSHTGQSGDGSESTASYTYMSTTGVTPTEWTVSAIRRRSRRFTLDLVPRLLFARGAMVELLISSNVSRYAEFKLVDRILTYYQGHVLEVPNCRASVFQSKEVSVLEKRLLMKFLSSSLNFDGGDPAPEMENKSLEDVMDEHVLTPLLKHYIRNAIAMSRDDASAEDGLSRVKRFLMSSGRYGNSPFLWPMYGCGELPQCFVRLCAVFGGTYCLRRKIDGLALTGNRCAAVLTEGQRIECSNIVINGRFFKDAKRKSERLNRAILLTDRSLLPAKRDQISVLVQPHPALPVMVQLLELPSTSMVCPPDMFVTYLTTESDQPAADVFAPIIDWLFTEDKSKELLKPVLFWSAYYDQEMTSDPDWASEIDNLAVSPSPTYELDYDSAVQFARDTFAKLYPEEEFLPAAPNPDEILLMADDRPGNGYPPTENEDTVETESENTSQRDAESCAQDVSQGDAESCSCAGSQDESSIASDHDVIGSEPARASAGEKETSDMQEDAASCDSQSQGLRRESPSHNLL